MLDDSDTTAVKEHDKEGCHKHGDKGNEQPWAEMERAADWNMHDSSNQTTFNVNRRCERQVASLERKEVLWARDHVVEESRSHSKRHKLSRYNTTSIGAWDIPKTDKQAFSYFDPDVA